MLAVKEKTSYSRWEWNPVCRCERPVISPLGHERLLTSLKLILILTSFFVTSCLSAWKCWGFFLAKCVRNVIKTMVVDRKNLKAQALLYLASKPLRKAANWSGVPTEFEQNRREKFELFAWTLPPNFFRLNWTFPLPPLTNLFLTFVVFACFATTRVNTRIRDKNTRDLA